jgi:hypothetical protein
MLITERPIRLLLSCVHVLSFDVSPTSSSDQSTSSLSFTSFSRFSITQRQESRPGPQTSPSWSYIPFSPQARPFTQESTLNDVADQSNAHNQVKVKVFRGHVEVIIISLSFSVSICCTVAAREPSLSPSPNTAHVSSRFPSGISSFAVQRCTSRSPHLPFSLLPSLFTSSGRA